MKVTVTEIREAKFSLLPIDTWVDIKYKVTAYSGSTSTPAVKTFDDQESVEIYIKFLKERENDYSKVIKEIEI